MPDKFKVGYLVVINEKKQVYKIIYKTYYNTEKTYMLQNIKNGYKLELSKREYQLRIATPLEIVNCCHG